MGTKENIEYIKQELSNEEKLLESVIKLEKWYKKYKKPLVGAVIMIVLIGVGYMGYEWKKQHNLHISNQAFNKLLLNPQDKKALETLQSTNPELYDLYLYHQAMQTRNKQLLKKLTSSKNPIIADLAIYHLAVVDKNNKKLKAYMMRNDALLKEMAGLDDGYLLFSSDRILQGKEDLSQISKESPAYPYALLLKHYGVKVAK